MKKIDKLLIQSFIPPFIVTFFIAIFVLIMQFLWLHIDDIIGKGTGIIILTELIFYASIALIPKALPIAVIISSVMVMGNLAEQYELASMKSAGIPLIRIMRPLMFVTAGITIGSLLCSNYLIPLANLQYKTRLKDISRQKMALNLETGVFNDDFKNMAIHIGKKGSDGKEIEDVIIHDFSTKGTEPMKIIAERGEMYLSSDNKHLIMNLFNGVQYQETGQSKTNISKGLPFSRTSFNQWNKVFDLSEFDLKLEDREKYNEHYKVLSVPQLQTKIDTLDKHILKRFTTLKSQFDQYVVLGDPVKNKTVASAPTSEKKPIEQNISQPLKKYKNITQVFQKTKDRATLLTQAKTYAKSVQSKALSTERQLVKEFKNRDKYVYELNIKFSFALVCFIFLFIGAPMGAIIKKGGFGFPILISISFFLFYIVLNILFKKLTESMLILPEVAAWLPCAVLFPIGIILTYKAMNNIKIWEW